MNPLTPPCGMVISYLYAKVPFLKSFGGNLKLCQYQIIRSYVVASRLVMFYGIYFYVFFSTSSFKLTVWAVAIVDRLFVYNNS